MKLMICPPESEGELDSQTRTVVTVLLQLLSFEYTSIHPSILKTENKLNENHFLCLYNINAKCSLPEEAENGNVKAKRSRELSERSRSLSKSLSLQGKAKYIIKPAKT